MTLPASGSISIQDIATELGVSLPLDINAANVRTLAGVASGNIVMPNDFWGKSNADLIPNAIDLYDVIVTGSYGDASGVTNTVTFSGINQAINITIDTTNAEANAFTVGGGANSSIWVYAMVNGAQVGSITWSRSSNGQTTGMSRSMTFSVPVNGTLYLSCDFFTSGINNAGNGGASATLNVKNASRGNTLLDTLVVSLDSSYEAGGL